MQIAISTYSLSRWRKESGKSLEQSLDWIAGCGVRGVELAGLDEKPASHPLRRAASLRRRCEKLRLAVVGYCVPAELFVAAPLQQEIVDRLKSHVDAACELGTAWMRHDVTRGPVVEPGEHRPTLRQVIREIVPAIRHVAEYAAKQGVHTSFENHGYYMQPSRTVEQLLLAVAHPNFGLTLDMGNFMVVGEDPVQAVRRLAKYAGMVHVKDFHTHQFKKPPTGWFATTKPGCFLRGAIVGHGQIDIAAQMRVMQKSGYTGWFSLEFEGIEEPTKGVSLGLEYLRSLVEDGVIGKHEPSRSEKSSPPDARRDKR